VWFEFPTRMGARIVLTSIRNCLVCVLVKEGPGRDLPESFKYGCPLPMKPNPWRKKNNSPRRKRENHRPRFVHGCELLAV